MRRLSLNDHSKVVISTFLVLGLSSILCVSIPQWMSLTRQYNTANDIPRWVFENHGEFYGRVLKVIDGDTVRIRHYPFYPFIQSHTYTGPLSKNTISVRFYGIDAPELGKSGNRSMPKAEEAREWVKQLIDGEVIKVKVLRKDYYNRVVGEASSRPLIPFLFPRKDLSLELARQGYATMYTGGGSKYNGKRHDLETAIDYTKRKRRGLWVNGPGSVISPADYKRKYYH